MKSRKIICIVGPTASGKTDWGVKIARKFDGEIISADSRQIYRFLDIGTGKEGVENPKSLPRRQAGKTQMSNQIQNPNVKKLVENIRWVDEVPQWLIDICEPGEKFTMFDWLAAAQKVIEDIFRRGKLPVVVGGTGLYVQALTEGFTLEKSEIRMSKSETNNRQNLEKKPKEELQEILKRLDPVVYKQIDKNNLHRLIRAIERAQAGEIVSKKRPDFEVLQIAIDLPRAELYQRIDQRVDQWFRQGFVEEVQGLLKSGVDPKWLEKIGLEYRLLTKYLLKNPKSLPRRQAGKTQMSNEIQSPNVKFEEMKQKMKFAIHSYARRQLTWFRRFSEIIWCRDLKAAKKEFKKFLAS